MNRLRKLLLACAIVPLSQIALQSAARAEEGNLLLAQAAPACQPGDPNCVPPEQAAPKQPEVQPQAEPERPQPEAAPPAPEPEARPEAPAPEVQPEPPKPQAEPPAPQPEPQAIPPAPQPEPDVKPQEPAPRPEAQPEAPAPQPEAERPKPAPEAAPSPEPKPERHKPHVERPAAEPEAGATTPARKPDARPQPKPDTQPESAPPQPEPTVPQPKDAPTAEPEAQPTPPSPAQPDVTPAPPPAPDAAVPGTPPPPVPDAAAPGTPPPPPAQPGDQPPAPPESAEKQAPPSALIEKLGNPGAAVNEAIDRSVDQKAGNLRDVQRERRVISDEGGVRVTVEPGGRVIVQSGEQALIRHDDRARFDRDDRDFRERRTRDGGREVIVATRDGGEVKTIYDPNGIMVQRERWDRDGRAYVLFDNRSFGPGPVDEPEWQQVVRLPPPPVYDLPRERYRVEMRSAPPRYVEEALIAPPLVEVLPQYTLDQVIYSPDLRDRVRSVDLDTITFSSGAWTVESGQVASIDAVARGIDAALRRNPNEVFLVEGYTDAVGSVVDNLSLSDRRAEAVANVLTEHYGIPPENLVTQGYGESYLKIQTEAAERANRRVTLRRITPLLSTKAQP